MKYYYLFLIMQLCNLCHACDAQKTEETKTKKPDKRAKEVTFTKIPKEVADQLDDETFAQIIASAAPGAYRKIFTDA